MRARTFTAAVLLVGVTLMAGCGKSSGTSPASAAPDLAGKTFLDETKAALVQVNADDNNFDPQYVTVKVGTTVTFKNRGRNSHNVVPVTSGSLKAIETDAFKPGTSVERSFTKAGLYSFYCSLHGTATKGMNGTIKVVG